MLVLDKCHYKDMEQMGRWMSEGKIKAVIDSVYEVKDIRKAFERLKSGRVVGKVVVRFKDVPTVTIN